MIAADALGLCAARLSAAMILTMLDKRVPWLLSGNKCNALKVQVSYGLILFVILLIATLCRIIQGWGLLIQFPHRTWSTLVQVMACCLTAPSHYLKQFWFIISEVLWHSPVGNFTGNAQDMYAWYEFENLNYCQITVASLGHLDWYPINVVESLQPIWRLGTSRFLNMTQSFIKLIFFWSL